MPVTFSLNITEPDESEAVTVTRAVRRSNDSLRASSSVTMTRLPPPPIVDSNSESDAP